MLIGKFLIGKRKEKGWTQEEIADKLGVKRTTYASWEQSRNSVDMPMLLKMASLFEMNHVEIVKYAEDAGLNNHLNEENFSYGGTRISTELWEAKQQECNDLREHNKDLKLLVETQQKMVETHHTLVDTQKKLIESLEQQLQPFKEIKEKAGANG